jgi:hypothetical protein
VPPLKKKKSTDIFKIEYILGNIFRIIWSGKVLVMEYKNAVNSKKN